MKTVLIITFATSVGLGVAGCADTPDDAPAVRVVPTDPFGVPVAGLSADEIAQFNRGDAAFEHTYRPSEGLGPVFIRSACASCHARDGRGPGTVERFVAVEADGITMAQDQSALPWGPVMRPQFASMATRGVTRPMDAMNLRESVRFGPAIVGRGWMEAIPDSAITAQAELEAREGVVSGRVNVRADGHIGRFGHKGSVATIDDFTANAFQGDMGLTSAARPTESPNPDGLTDDDRPGPDLSDDVLRDVGFYVRALALPARTGLTADGARLFASTGCAHCHTPSMPTRADALHVYAGGRAEVYSDLLIHDLGSALADGVVEESANEREWRTAPLIGMRFQRSFLHDGRAFSLEEAVQMHRGDGSEANGALSLFDRLSATERQTLLDFVQHL